jgi:ubiquinone/menaquinone biosynthesis C-methylase UbiE
VAEIDLIKERYEQRQNNRINDLYSRLLPSVYLSVQERQRAIIRILNKNNLAPVSERRVLEVGCGSGSNLLELLSLGFQAQNLVGNELLDYRLEEARKRLPEAIQLLLGDASQLDLEPSSFDIAFQSTVFSSILDDTLQQSLATRMWELVRPGGGVLWYDFTFNNPKNPDVRGVPLARIHTLFPEGRVHAQRVTLAPPLSRRVTKIHPALYGALNTLPFLRTHVLCWIAKPQK